MPNTDQKVMTPPYATYKSFTNLINDLRENGVPDQITRSVLNGSNSGKAMMGATLKYLKLVDDDGFPSDMFKQLVDNEEDYNMNLNILLETHYPFLFDESINLANTTTEIVQRKFQDQGASGSTVSKCMAFFLSAASAAQINVSDRVKAPTPPRKPKAKKKPNTATKDTVDSRLPPEKNEPEIPEGMERITIPFRDFEDGIVFLPEDLEQDDAKRAIKMMKFILEEYYSLDD